MRRFQPTIFMSFLTLGGLLSPHVTGSDHDLAWIEREMDCPNDDSTFIAQPSIPWGAALRAYRTIPPGISLDKSVIPEAGRGVFTNVFIQRYTWLGRYEGTPLPRCEAPDDPNNICAHLPSGCEYTFRIHRGGVQRTLLDGGDTKTSNWLRWINCARTVSEQNVAARECMGIIYFQVIKDISPGTELLVYYGYDYTTDLGIDAYDFEKTYVIG